MFLITIFSIGPDQVVGPPAAGAFRERPSKPTTFRKYYERGEFPIALGHDNKGNSIAWKVGQSQNVVGTPKSNLWEQMQS